MNWLAHLFLSQPNVENRLGNILADVVKGSARQQLNSGLQRGIRCHQFIDSFTDSHLIVQRSKQRIGANHRRFAGVLVDVFYDHFLASNWCEYSDVALEEFIAEIYESFLAYRDLPTQTSEFLAQMVRENWLGAYRNVKGVEKTLERISKRLAMRHHHRTFHLHLAINELITHYNCFEQDFDEFFPELIASVRTREFRRENIDNEEDNKRSPIF